MPLMPVAQENFFGGEAGEKVFPGAYTCYEIFSHYSLVLSMAI